MTKKTDTLRIVFIVVAWILFAGLGIEAGGFLTHTIATLAYSPEGATRFWSQADLSDLYHFNQGQYVMLSGTVIIAAVLKTLMFYFIVRILHDPRLDLAKPFNDMVRRFVLLTAYIALGVGLFSFWGAKITRQLVDQGIKMPDVEQLRIAGADVWLFMGITLLVVAYIFRKGVEIQTENDLTV